MFSTHVPACTLWCYRHHQECEVRYGDLHTDGSRAGTTCVGFTARSKGRLGGLGTQQVPFACWLTTRAHAQEMLTVHECVKGHPSEKFLRRRLKEDAFFIVNWLLSPAVFGRPAARERLYTVAIRRRDMTTPLYRCPGPDVELSFKVVADCSIWFSAKEYEVHAFMAASGITLFKEALAQGHRQRQFHNWHS